MLGLAYGVLGTVFRTGTRLAYPGISNTLIPGSLLAPETGDYLCCQSAPLGQSSMNPCSHSMSQSLDLAGPMYQGIICVSVE